LIPDWNVCQFSTIEQIRWLTKKKWPIGMIPIGQHFTCVWENNIEKDENGEITK
jgi:hypothetical protein